MNAITVRPFGAPPSAEQRPRYRTGEVTKNWINGEPCSKGLLAQNVEEVMAMAAAEGYRFLSAALSTAYSPAGDMMTETCILFFEREVR